MNIPLKHMPKLADRLKYVRRLKDLTQDEMADLAGTTQQAVQQAEAGQARNPRYLHRLSIELDIPFEWLSLNMLPEDMPKRGAAKGLSEKDAQVVNTFKSMSKKDQDLILELMRSRQKKS